MSLKYSPLFALFFSFFFLLLSSTNAFNITKLLEQYPSFTTFNNYLTQTQLVDAINSRQSITVLAVDNGALSTLSSQSTDTIKKILSVHVILDYFDVQKLQNLEKKSAILTTLFQSSGQATGQQGFLNVTHLSTGGVAFGSAVPGSNLGSNLVKSIASQPYNISVLQVNNVIMPTGMNGGNTNSSTNSSTSTSPSPASTPSKSPTTQAATPSKAPTTPPTSKASPPSTANPPAAATTPKSSKVPAPTTAPSNAEPPSNANAPSDDAADSPSDDAADSPSGANAPSDANAPTADSPVGSPPMPADAPAADAPATIADGPADDTSGAPEMFGINLAVLLVMVVSSTWSLASVM